MRFTSVSLSLFQELEGGQMPVARQQTCVEICQKGEESEKERKMESVREGRKGRKEGRKGKEERRGAKAKDTTLFNSPLFLFRCFAAFFDMPHVSRPTTKEKGWL